MSKIKDLLLKNKGNKKPTISPYSSIETALKVMSDAKIDALAVVDGNIIVGVIEKGKILNMLFEDKNLNLNKSLFNIMEMKVLYASKDYRLEECVSLMSQKKIFYLPVLENEEYIDMVSLHEIACEMLEDKEYVIANLTHYISGNIVFNINNALPIDVRENILDLTKLKEKYIPI